MRARLLRLHPMTAKKLLRLKKEAEAEGAARVARRIHAVLLNHDGYASGKIAALLNAERSRKPNAQIAGSAWLLLQDSAAAAI